MKKPLIIRIKYLDNVYENTTESKKYEQRNPKKETYKQIQ
jgi:hypothetical protein